VIASGGLDNQSYYDEFASWYERERGQGYHQLIDDLETELVLRHGRGKDVLEAGCGTGLILGRVAREARSARGVDLSAGMLEKARERGLDVVQGSITALPYPDASFDVTYSFKVLAHIEDIRTAMRELARVTRPGGVVLAEFYNTRSLRYLIKRLKPATAISDRNTDEAVFTRYDSLAEATGYLPPELELESTRGVRIVSPAAALYKLAPVASVLGKVEHALADLPGVRNLGGFLILVARKRS
jgi:ubiquinone/menaquinone biosynthesis C-methylase UbiE